MRSMAIDFVCERSGTAKDQIVPRACRATQDTPFRRRRWCLHPLPAANSVLPPSLLTSSPQKSYSTSPKDIEDVCTASLPGAIRRTQTRTARGVYLSAQKQSRPIVIFSRISSTTTTTSCRPQRNPQALYIHVQYYVRGSPHVVADAP